MTSHEWFVEVMAFGRAPKFPSEGLGTYLAAYAHHEMQRYLCGPKRLKAESGATLRAVQVIIRPLLRPLPAMEEVDEQMIGSGLWFLYI